MHCWVAGIDLSFQQELFPFLGHSWILNGNWTHLARYTFTNIGCIRKSDCFWDYHLEKSGIKLTNFELACTMSLEKGLAQNSVTLIGEKSASPSFAHLDWVHSIRSPFGSALQVNIDFISEAPSSLARKVNVKYQKKSGEKNLVKTLNWAIWPEKLSLGSKPPPNVSCSFVRIH